MSNLFGVTTEDLRRLERRRDSLLRVLSIKRAILARDTARMLDMIATIENDLATTVDTLKEKTEEWELNHSSRD
jgi:hypothetical protein